MKNLKFLVLLRFSEVVTTCLYINKICFLAQLQSCTAQLQSNVDFYCISKSLVTVRVL